MGMVDMKTSGDDYGIDAASSNPYGYGLCINLTDEQVEALGLNVNPPAAGTEVGVRAIAKVVTITQDVNGDPDDGEVGVSLSLQITSMEVNPEAPNNNDAAATLLYGA